MKIIGDCTKQDLSGFNIFALNAISLVLLVSNLGQNTHIYNSDAKGIKINQSIILHLLQFSG